MRKERLEPFCAPGCGLMFACGLLKLLRPAVILFRADEFHTFDDALIALSGNVAGHRLIICKPIARNPELDLQKPKP
jgi:hypothetical protein